jgi:hypothetical protein
MAVSGLDGLAFALRVTLGAVFLFAGTAKARQRADFAAALDGYAMLPIISEHGDQLVTALR